MNRQAPSSPSSPSFLARVVLAFALLLGAASGLDTRAAGPDVTAAPTVAAPAPAFAGLFKIKGTTNRTRVVQIAAVGMALALFIIMRSTKY